MNINMSAVYKLEVESDCTCKVTAEYKDAAYKEPLSEAVAHQPCEAHADPPVAKIVADMLSQTLRKHAEDYKLAPVAVQQVIHHVGSAPSYPSAPVVIGADGEPVRPSRHQREKAPPTELVASGPRTVATIPARTAERQVTAATPTVQAPRLSPSTVTRISTVGTRDKLQVQQQLAQQVHKVGSKGNRPAQPSSDIDMLATATEDPRLTSMLEDMDLFHAGDEDYSRHG